MSELVKLLAAIQESGLELLAREKAEYAWTTATRIIATGKDLECRFPEMQPLFDEDTAMTARVLSNPIAWGIDDPLWAEFTDRWLGI